MNLKASFGKYKAKEVDSYLLQLEAAHKEEIASLNKKIAELEAENTTLKSQNDEHKKKESVIAQVMIDATQRAKDIEDDYRKRADESDAACQKLHDEWVEGMQSAAVNLQKMREEARTLLENIDGQFASLCSWADMRLDSLQGAALPSGNKEESLESEIQKGASADLGELCRKLGISEESEEASGEE